MKILLVHNVYKHHGGEDSVLAAETWLLRKEHHNTQLYQLTNTEVGGLFSKLKTALSCRYSMHSKRSLRNKMDSCQPDLVHVHNFFPLFTPSIYDACIEAGLPVVQTLHNYRTICPGALLVRGGKICEKCITGSPYQAFVHRCYRDSLLGSLTVARMVSYHREKKTWKNKVDRYIALTEFAKSKFIQAGFPDEKIAVKPNFYEEKVERPDEEKNRKGGLFVGRLSEEKGIRTLMQSWKGMDVPLRIAGEGSLNEFVAKAKYENIVSLGQLTSAQVSDEMSKASFLVMPSESYETFGMVIIEAFAHGLPVIASRLGAMAEIVEDGVTGLHFEPGNAADLARKVLWLHDHPEESRRMGENARRVYEEKYTPERNYEMLMDIYQQAIAEHKQKSSR